MIYLYWYLGVGAVVLAIVYGLHRLTKQDDEWDFLREYLDARYPKRKKLWYRILNKLVAPALAAVAVVAVWPIAAYVQGRALLSKKGAAAVPRVEAPEFAVRREHLLERLTVSEIEAREFVFDPLGAAPQLPFGHLNAAWRKFIEGVGPDDELWSFTALWKPEWGDEEIRAGYAVVRGDLPGSHFLAMSKEADS